MMVDDCRRSGAQRVHPAERCAHPAGILEQGTVKAPPEVLEHIEEAMGYTPSADASRVHRIQMHMRVEQPREQRHAGGIDLLPSCNRPGDIHWNVPRGQTRNDTVPRQQPSSVDDKTPRRWADNASVPDEKFCHPPPLLLVDEVDAGLQRLLVDLSLIHISEPTRLGMISYAVFCL